MNTLTTTDPESGTLVESKNSLNLEEHIEQQIIQKYEHLLLNTKCVSDVEIGHP